MKLRIRHKISFEKADELIEKYYDGFTTTEEEKLLQQFLSQNNLPNKYQAEQAIFGYFKQKKPSTNLTIKKWIQWAGAAAAVLILAFGIHNYSTLNTSNYAYIDGVKITDQEEIKSQALATLSEISKQNNEVKNCINSLNDKEIMQQQLDVFSALSE